MHFYIYVRTLVFIVVFLIKINFIFAQQGKIQFGKTDVALNEMFEITILLENDRIKNYSAFPEIQGFVKRGTSSSTSTSSINGNITTVQSISQRYQPTKEGTFALKPFSISVNAQSLQSNGTTIKVSAARKTNTYDPFAELWGSFNRDSDRTNEFVDVKDDAFFAITNNKNQVYVGEGFTMTIAFYVSESNRAQMNFYELGEQLTNILKKVKPLNAWEENFGIEEITPEQTMINGKAYSEYKIYRGTFYPLSAGTIEIPSAELKMIKYKVAKNPSFFGQNTQQDFKSFTSAPKKVIVKDLPPHPLQGNIAVGNYRLNEKLEKEQTQTGKSVEYSFQIEGEGNISAINEPLINDSEHFDIYPPNVFQNIRRSGLVYGTKNFKYYLVPNEPGRYDLSNHLTWIFFNTSTYKYDTLKPKSHLEVSGESVVSKMVQSEEMTGLYANISNFDDSIQSFDDIDWLKGLISAFLVGVCGVCIFMFWRLKKKTKTKN